jgi:EpsI family protein
MIVRSWRASWAVAMVLLLALLLAYQGYRPRPVALARDVDALSETVGDWKGEASDPPAEIVRAPGAHHELNRVYRNAAGRSAHLYLAYFETQARGRKLVSHVTKDWHQRAEPFEIAGPDGSVVLVNRVVTRAGREGRVIFFWYDVGGRVIASRYVAKLASVSDALMRRRDNGAMVAVALEPGLGLDEAGIEGEIEFLRALQPLLRAYLSGAAA